ncbi:MAG: glycosyltransferase family 4 protein [Thermoproteales archaeon]|nr:glycosyltransferase family 4 protein [Thermoproteales archaeon]
MKIFHITWEYPPNIVGGLGRHVFYLTKYLAKLGADVHVITTDVEGRGFENIEGVKVHRVDPFTLKSIDFITWILNFNYLMIVKVLELVDEVGEPDVIHVHDWLTAYSGIILKHVLKVPLVTTIHATEIGRRGGIWSEDQRIIHDWEWRVTYESWKVVVCSDYMIGEVGRVFMLPPEKIVKIPNAIELSDIERFEPEPGLKEKYASPHEKIIVFVGRHVYEKGPDLLVEAFNILINDFKRGDVKLVIVGDGPMREHLVSMVHKYGLRDKVYFTGRISDKELFSLMKVSYVGVFPSRYEPFGIAILEAMSCGLPVIVPRHGGPSEIIRHGVEGFKISLDPREIAERIRQLLDDTQLRDLMSVNARKRVKKLYTWDRIARFTLEVYRSISKEAKERDWKHLWKRIPEKEK